MGWCLQTIFLMLLACHRKKLWPKTFFITACKFSDSSSKYYVIACKFWGSWHENFETLPSVSHPVHSKYVIPTTLGLFGALLYVLPDLLTHLQPGLDLPHRLPDPQPDEKWRAEGREDLLGEVGHRHQQLRLVNVLVVRRDLLQPVGHAYLSVSYTIDIGTASQNGGGV